MNLNDGLPLPSVFLLFDSFWDSMELAETIIVYILPSIKMSVSSSCLSVIAAEVGTYDHEGTRRLREMCSVRSKLGSSLK